MVQHYNENGLVSRKHKLTGKASTIKNSLTPEDLQNVVTFIKAYAEKVSIPLPNHLPQFRNFDKIVKLPSCDTKLVIYRKFVEAVDKDENFRVVSQSSFYNIWEKYCPEVMTMKPATDLCDTCRQNHLQLSKMHKLSVDKQEKILEAAKDHLEKAKLQREFYNLLRN